MFGKQRVSLHLASAAAVALSAGVAFAGQTVHFDQNFTDNSIADEVGSVNGLFPGLGFSLQPQQSWRGGAGVSYYGPSGSVAFNPPTGYGAGGAPPAGNAGLGFGGYFGASVANNAVLQPGNVWVFDMGMISDLAGTNPNTGALQLSPGIAVEVADFTTFGDDGAVMATKAANVGSTFAVAYPNGADGTTEPDALPQGHTAALSNALNQEIRTKYVFQPAPTGGANPLNLSTRVSVQASTPTLPVASAGHYDGSASPGNFRSDYNAGLFVQLMNNHGDGNVTYAAGVTGLTGGSAGKVDVAYNDAENVGNLQLGLTRLTFKQVRQGDFNTDGVVDVSSDFVTWNSNRGATSGKSFFDGDANGDGAVDVSSDFVIWNSQRGTDLVGNNQGLAEYDPATGIVRVSTNGATFIEINSAFGNLITANAVPLASVPNALFQDPPTASKINYAGINALGAGGFLDDFSLGAILPTGITSNEGLTFRWSNPGVPAVEIPITIVPEPAGLVVLSGLAGLSFVRRRRAAA